MKSKQSKIILVLLLLALIFSCNKNREQFSNYDMGSMGSDSISYGASQEIEGRKFVKMAEVNMEVKDVYDATIFIEQKLKELGGFVVQSRLNSNTISEEVFEVADTKSILVKKFQTENRMQVRVPSEKLSDFLALVNNQKLFLHSRVIISQDVSNSAKIIEFEKDKNQKIAEVIANMKNNITKLKLTDENLEQNNYQEIKNIMLSDSLKYSFVELYIAEPKLRISEIAIENVKNIDNKYKFNFFYDAKNAIVEGFYLIQKVIIILLYIWPILLIGSIVIFFLIKKK